jgi:glutathione peroxidase
MKKFSLIPGLCVLWAGMFLLAEDNKLPSVYQFKETSIEGKEVDFSKYQGKALLIVNVASQCGATSQYEGLQALSEYFKEKGLIVMGFPTNDFGAQEPGTNEEIKQFCTSDYKVTFPMFAKGPVKGERKSDLFKFLTTSPNPDRTGDIGWNFEKFLVGKDGKLKRRFSTSVDPYDKEFVAAIQKELGEK